MSKFLTIEEFREHLINYEHYQYSKFIADSILNHYSEEYIKTCNEIHADMIAMLNDDEVINKRYLEYLKMI